MSDLSRLYALPDDALVNSRSAAQYLAMEPRSLERLRRDRLIPFHRLSATAVRYRVGDLREWLAARRVPAEAA